MLGEADNLGLERESALLEWIQQFAPYGVVTLDQSFRVQSWNHWMEVHSGVRLADATGKSLFELFPDLQERRLTSHFERALQGESSVLSTALHRYLLRLPSPYREAGSENMLQTARIAPLYSQQKVCGIVLVIEDVTQRESQAEALNRQHRRDELLSWALAHLLKVQEPRKSIRQLFFKIAEHLEFDSFLIYLKDLETERLNLEAVGGIGLEIENDFRDCALLTSVAEAHDTLVFDSVQSSKDSRFAVLQKARISSAVAIPLSIDRRNLGLLCFASWSRDTIAPEEADLVKTIAQYLATALDKENTNWQLQKAKEQLAEHAQLLEQRVNERTARLRETISELETFSYTIAHDLRAPARGISGYCEVILEDFSDSLPSGAKSTIDRIARASARMETLTRDLLEFSKVSRQEISLGRVELEPIIEDLAALRLPAVRQAITICSPLHPVLGHRGLLQHVFSNLIDNAVKFVQSGSVPKVTVSAELVSQGSPNTRRGSLIFSSARSAPQTPATAERTNPAQFVRIWVQDEGIGIPREAHQKIFGIFEQALVPGKYEGTGIGLAIVARAMQRMSGTCGVESEPGRGSRFWLELPAA